MTDHAEAIDAAEAQYEAALAWKRARDKERAAQAALEAAMAEASEAWRVYQDARARFEKCGVAS